MKRREIAKVLKRHRGSVAQLAKRSGGIPANAVSMWLAGGANSNLDREGPIFARELLAREEAARLASGEANGPSVRKLINEVLTKGIDDPNVKPLIDRLTKKTSQEES